MGTVPNEFHFIFGLTPDFGGKPFSLVHYLAVASCAAVNRPAAMYFYYRYEPDGEWWERAKPLLTLQPVEPPDEVFGNALSLPAHKADVLRLDILLRRGGVYLDMDVICVRPFAPLFEFETVLGEELGEGLCNAVILAQAGAPFLARWREEYRTFTQTRYNQHSVRLPRELAKELPEQVHVVDYRQFFWPLYRLEDLRAFFMRPGSTFLAESYCVHLWEAITWPHLRRLTPGHLWNVESEFCQLARQYAERPGPGEPQGLLD